MTISSVIHRIILSNITRRTFLKIRSLYHRYIFGFVSFIVIASVLTVMGIQLFVAPKLYDLEKTGVYQNIQNMSQKISLELVKIEAQSRTITQVVP